MPHGSFVDMAPDRRLSITMGFRRRSAAGRQGKPGMGAGRIRDEQRIPDRSAVIRVAIDARRQRFPDEAPPDHRLFPGPGDGFRLNDGIFERMIRDGNTRDLAI